MNVVKCKNGHFFDGDAYTQCPHCGEAVDIGASAPMPSRKKTAKKFGWGKKENKPANNEARRTEGVWNGGKTPTDVLNQASGIGCEQRGNGGEEDGTLDFWKTSSQSGGNIIVEVANGHIVPTNQTEEIPTVVDGTGDGGNDDTTVTTDAANAAPPPAVDDQEEALRAVVKKASASSVGKTMSYFTAATTGSEAVNAPQVSSEPVVGWLVCIGGKHFGQSFVIGAGKNSIGRNDDNRIVLFMDNSVSRAKHALITYEPKKRNFYLQPGDSSGLTYLNDEYIDESKKLKAKDIIELGESKFVFVPLCDETFTWENYMRKEQ